MEMVGMQSSSATAATGNLRAMLDHTRSFDPPRNSAPPRERPKPAISREAFECESIREFAHSGLDLGPRVSRDERRERIRTAIYREGKAGLIWRDSGLTYAEIFRQAYHQPLDARGEVVAEDVTLRSLRSRPSIETWGRGLGIDEDEDEDDAEDSAQAKEIDS
jgi:hypothetical protein